MPRPIAAPLDDAVAQITARAVEAPLRHRLKTASGTIETSPLVLIDLTTARGVVGRAYLFAYMPAALEATRRMVVELGRALAGQPLSPFDLDARLSQALRLLGRTGVAAMAAAGIDMAVWDAFATAQGKPLWAVLGGTRRPLPAYDSQGLDGIALGRERTREAVGQGFTAIKTKLGYDTVEEDVATLRALRQAAGPGAAIMADYNQKLTVDEAVARVRALAEAGFGEGGLAWVEEPTLQEDYAGHAEIRAASAIPIQLGENWFGAHEMEKALAAGACDLVMPDAMKIGGVTGWLEAAAIAERHGVPMSNHLFPEISAHLLCVTPTAHWLEYMDLAGPVLAGAPVVRDGVALAGDAPGVGLRWNEEAVGRYGV